MAQLKKALDRLEAKPNDYRWEELTRLMESLGYLSKTSGGSGRKLKSF